MYVIWSRMYKVCCVWFKSVNQVEKSETKHFVFTSSFASYRDQRINFVMEIANINQPTDVRTSCSEVNFMTSNSSHVLHDTHFKTFPLKSSMIIICFVWVISDQLERKRSTSKLQETSVITWNRKKKTTTSDSWFIVDTQDHSKHWNTSPKR